MKALLCGGQVLVGEVDAAVQRVDRLVRVAGDLRLGLLRASLATRAEPSGESRNHAVGLPRP